MMLKAVLCFALVAVVACDVSHLFKPTYNQRAPAFPTAYKPSPPGHPHHYAGNEGGILRQESDINPDGSYQFAYETQNGIAANEQGSVRQQGENVAKTAQGSYQFTSPEGQFVQISYVADENGYQPIGDAIPTPHPIPEAIQRAIHYIESHPAQKTYNNQQQQHYGRF